jgi:hypothetical protein
MREPYGAFSFGLVTITLVSYNTCIVLYGDIMVQTRSRERHYLVCENCGKEFDVPHYREDAKFCSKACRRKRVEVVCQKCGNKFEATFYQTQNGEAKYCSKKCMYEQLSIDRRGPGTPWFKGGSVGKRGYRMITVYDKDDKKKRMPEHRYVMEQHLGRKLLRSEDVHHRDGNKLNNELDNLRVMSKKDHTKLHFDLLEATGFWNGRKPE